MSNPFYKWGLAIQLDLGWLIDQIKSFTTGCRGGTPARQVTRSHTLRLQNLVFATLVKILSRLVVLELLISPAIAHKVEVTEDIAGTWHIEPNHAPKAGEPAEVWIALTRKGGTTLPLAEADCQLAVYSQPRQPEDVPILQPTLQAIDSEQYQGIPGANLIFPTTGLYQLDLRCTPKVAEDFQAFEMVYDVTVAAGTATPTPTPTVSSSVVSPTATSSPLGTEPTAPPDSRRTQPAIQWVVGAIALVAIGAIAGYFLLHHVKSNNTDDR
jgi:hypothetical protein